MDGIEAARMVEALSGDARRAARPRAAASAAAKDAALRGAAARLRRDEAAILRANADDVARARAAGESAAFVDRLTLTTGRIDAMAHGLEEVAALPDPVGETIAAWRRPNGLEIAQVRVPIGVVLSIYESRPNVTADSAALCLKTANAVLLKGGSEAQATNRAIAGAFRAEVEAAGLSAAAVQLVEGGREVTRGLLKRDDRIDADWDTEYLDLILSVAVVPSLDAALAFIARHSTGLAEAIVTEDYRAARRFLAEVDAAAVFVNASTRFTDGYEFGFGAEVGISTNRLHARGPMGLRELTTYKYQVQGSGQIRA